MDPRQTERAIESENLLKAILETIKVVKEYQLEIMASQRDIRQDLRNLDHLRPLKTVGQEKASQETA
jgi:hypothetical protein